MNTMTTDKDLPVEDPKLLEHLLGPDPAIGTGLRPHLENGFTMEPLKPTLLGYLGEYVESKTVDKQDTNRTIYYLTNVIQQDVRVQRFFVAGSYGRRVDIGGRIEIDIVVFLKHRELLPPFDTPGGVLFQIHRCLSRTVARRPGVTLDPLPPHCLPEVDKGSGTNSTDHSRRGSTDDEARLSEDEDEDNDNEEEEEKENGGKEEEKGEDECDRGEEEEEEEEEYADGSGSTSSSSSSDFVCLRDWKAVGPEGQATCVSLTIRGRHYNILPAPTLGWQGEEQRQASYRKMQRIAHEEESPMASLYHWRPSLVERASQSMASEGADVRAYIRVAKYWAYVHGVLLPPYAIETLALLTARRVRQEKQAQLDASRVISSPEKAPLTASTTYPSPHSPQQPGSGGGVGKTLSSKAGRSPNAPLTPPTVAETSQTNVVIFDALETLRAFLVYLREPETIQQLCHITPPANYDWLWDTATAEGTPVLVDGFNPYWNLLADVTPQQFESIRKTADFTIKRIDAHDRGRCIRLGDLFAPAGYKRPRSRNWTRRFFTTLMLLFLAAAVFVFFCAPPETIREFEKNVRRLRAEAHTALNPAVEQVRSVAQRIVAAAYQKRMANKSSLFVHEKDEALIARVFSMEWTD